MQLSQNGVTAETFERKQFPTDSATPVRILPSILSQVETPANSRGRVPITHRELYEHFAQLVGANREGITFSPKTLQGANMSLSIPPELLKEVQGHTGKKSKNIEDTDEVEIIPFGQMTKVLHRSYAEFNSNVEFASIDGMMHNLSALYTANYTPKGLQLGYAISLNNQVCSNGMVRPEYLFQKSGMDLDMRMFDRELKLWLLESQDILAQWQTFVNQLSEQYMTSDDLSQYVGELYRRSVIKSQPVDITTLNNAMREMHNPQTLFPLDSNGGTSKYFLYNHLTTVLNTTEISSLIRTKSAVSKYFLEN